MGKIVGMIAIKNYLGLTEATVMDAIHHEGLPAVKESGEWIVKSQAELDRWRLPDPDEKRGADKPKKAVKSQKPATEKSEGQKRRSRRSRKRNK